MMPQTADIKSVQDNSLAVGPPRQLGTTDLRHDGSIWAIAVSANAKTVATSNLPLSGVQGSPHPIRLWDVATGKELGHLLANGRGTRLLA